MSDSHQTVVELTEHFGLAGVLAFDVHGDLTRAQVTLPGCSATVYLQGAHLAHWQPAKMEPVLFLSAKSEFVTGKPIRGGVPVCWPWFGADAENRAGGKPGPMHGFARTSLWQLTFAALLPGAEPELRMTFTLTPNEASRSFGYGDFRLVYEMSFRGARLALRLTTANAGPGPLKIEEALHSYFRVAEVRSTTIRGLEGAKYLDKRDAMKGKTNPATPLVLTEFTDRVYEGSTAAITIGDEGNHRTIHVVKGDSATTVVWNPFPEGSAAIKDLGPEEWPGFLCVEAANTASHAVTVAPGATHTMEVTVTAAAGL